MGTSKGWVWFHGQIPFSRHMDVSRKGRFSLFAYVHDDSYRMVQDQMFGFPHCALVTDTNVCLHQAHKHWTLQHKEKTNNKKINKYKYIREDTATWDMDLNKPELLLV
jgi:hypothetical protein